MIKSAASSVVATEFLTNILIDTYTSVSFCKVVNRQKTSEFCEYIEQMMV